MGYEMASEVDGISGVITAKKTLPDLILMDINLPYLDGLESTRRLKADPKTAHIPIVAITAYTGVGDRARCFEAGCDDYIAKPVTLKELRSVMTQLLHNSDGQCLSSGNSKTSYYRDSSRKN